MYLPVQMGHAIHPACGYIGDDTGENISERNANFCELTGLYWAAHITNTSSTSWSSLSKSQP